MAVRRQFLTQNVFGEEPVERDGKGDGSKEVIQNSVNSFEKSPIIDVTVADALQAQALIALPSL